MPKELVARGGFLLLGSESEPAGLFDGRCVRAATLQRTVTCVDVTASGDAWRSERPVRSQYELSGTAYLDGGSGQGLFALGDTCWATYYSQHSASSQLDRVLFQGPVVVTRVSDQQSQGDYEVQEITLRSSGAPAVG